MNSAGFTTKKIDSSKKLGEILKTARRKKDFSLKKVEKETKIKKEFIHRLENNKVKKLPEDIYVRGFLRKLADLYNIDSVKLISKYRRLKDNPSVVNNQTKIDFKNNRLKEPLVIITPKLISIGLAVVAGLFLLAYLWYEVSGFAIAPQLVLTSPQKEELQINKDQIRISGQTDQNSTLMINQESIPVGEDGKFDQKVRLQPGYNLLKITAINQGKRKASKNLKIIVNKKYAWKD